MEHGILAEWTGLEPATPGVTDALGRKSLDVSGRKFPFKNINLRHFYRPQPFA
jgi:hypothetical protein